MTGLMLIFAGSFLIGSASAHLMWANWRGRLLRNDLFAIRGELWDYAIANGLENDPAFVETRERLNRLVHVAPMLVPAHIRRDILREIDGGARPVSQSNHYPAACKVALSRAATRIARYILLEHVTGWALLAMIASRQMANFYGRAMIAARDKVIGFATGSVIGAIDAATRSTPATSGTCTVA